MLLQLATVNRTLWAAFCNGFNCCRWWQNTERCTVRHGFENCSVWIKLLWTSALMLMRGRDLYQRVPCKSLMKSNATINKKNWYCQMMAAVVNVTSENVFRHFRLNTIDMKYQIWKLGVVFTDSVRNPTASHQKTSLNSDQCCRLNLTLDCNFVFVSQSFLYLAWYMFVSVLGHSNNFFFAAHLLDIAMGFKTLRTILSSVTHNGKQVLCLKCIDIITTTNSKKHYFSFHHLTHACLCKLFAWKFCLSDLSFVSVW